MATSVKQMMEAANAAVPRITPAQARDMIAKGNTLVVDVRDAPEVIAGAEAVAQVRSSELAAEQPASRGIPGPIHWAAPMRRFAPKVS